MTIFEFIKIISQQKIKIIFIGIVVGVLSAIISQMLPLKYDSSLALNIVRVNREETNDYQYDGFYAIQASDLFAETIISWLQTPTIVREIFDASGKKDQVASISSLARQFKAKKLSSQNIVVRFSSISEDDAKAMNQALVEVISKKADASLSTAKDQPVFEVKAGDPVILQKKYDPTMVMLIGLISGLVLGIFWVLGENYFREKR